MSDSTPSPSAPPHTDSADAPVALVTGGSRGIGFAVVDALATEGYRVHLLSKNPDSVARALETFSERHGDRVSGRAVDVSSQEEVDAFVEEVLEAHDGRLDLLVNNAGLGHFGPVDELTGDQWRQVLRVNLDGVFYCTRAVAPAMRRRGSGFIVNVGSLASRNPFAGGAAYNASKFGLLGLTEASMLDLRQDGVMVVAVLPGSVETDFGGGSGGDASWKLQPEDVARAILDVLAYPGRALASRIELRPSQPKKG